MLLCLRGTGSVSEYKPKSGYDSENVKSFVEIAGKKEGKQRESTW